MNKYDKFLIECTVTTAKESYCSKAKVGAILANEGRIVANGYNGTISGHENTCEFMSTCKYCKGKGKLKVGHSKFECKDCKGIGSRFVSSPFVVHAEQNLLAFCAKEGIKTAGLTMYITLSPCTNCAKYIVQSGIKRVVYLNKYKDTSGIQFLLDCNVLCEEFKEN